MAILIPAYGRPAMTLQAVKDALATGAGAVIVSDDASNDDPTPAIRALGDTRLTVVRQPENLGLWRNHLALLRLTDKPWIKFLQTDDSVSPSALRTMCEHATPETTLVSVLPLYRDLDTGEIERRYCLDRPLRWATGEYVDRMAQAGNEPGRPSYTLFRRDALVDTPEAWRNDMSCDLVANVVAASMGEVVLLPPGEITCGMHAGRDGATQSFDLLMKRLTHALAFLSQHPDARIRRFVSIYGAVETIALGRVFLGKRRRRHKASARGIAGDLLVLARAVRVQHVLGNPRWALKYFRHKYSARRPVRIEGPQA